MKIESLKSKINWVQIKDIRFEKNYHTNIFYVDSSSGEFFHGALHILLA